MIEGYEGGKLSRKSGELSRKSFDTESVPTDLIGRLLDDASQKFGGDNYASNEAYKRNTENRYATPLSDEYAPLLFGGNPQDMKMVSYLDYRYRERADVRRDERSVMLSTHATQEEAGDYLREVTYEQKNKKKFVEIGEFINEDHKTKFGEVPIGEFIKPQGQASATYEILPDGKKKLVKSFVRRTDDITLKKPQEGVSGGRWTRLFSVNEKDRLIGSDIMYADRYHTSEEGSGVDVWFNIDGTLEAPKHITIQIGTAGEETSQKKSWTRKVNVVTRGNADDELAFLQNEPSYQFLFENGEIKRPGTKEVQKFVAERVEQLQHDWNNPQNIFVNRTLEANNNATAIGDTQ